MPKRIFSGVQPTGSVHLGNYLGALRNWVRLQHQYESFFCIVNLHAITTQQEACLLAEKTRELARIYLAVGIDPSVSKIFVQSEVPEHGELTWILNCVVRMSELERMTQFKDKVSQQRENRESVRVGLFDYPVLMAADILLYQTELVPVGEDQKQHLELTRDLAIRFNRDYGKTFQIPEPYIPQTGARIMSLTDPSRKMSKSNEDANGCVMLLDDKDTVARKFRRAMTDSGTEIRFDSNRPAVNNLLTIYQLITNKQQQEVEDHFIGKSYGNLKTELADVTIDLLEKVQARVKETPDDAVKEILAQGQHKAGIIARKTLRQVKVAMGLKLRWKTRPKQHRV